MRKAAWHFVTLNDGNLATDEQVGGLMRWNAGNTVF